MERNTPHEHKTLGTLKALGGAVTGLFVMHQLSTYSEHFKHTEAPEPSQQALFEADLSGWGYDEEL